MIVRGLVLAGGSDDLCQAFKDRLRWPEAVNAELRRAARHVAGLGSFLDRGCATVLELDDRQHQEALDLQRETLTNRELRGLPTKNLGEAQCVAVCREQGMPVITHDEKGREWARRARPEVQLGTIIDVLYVMVRLGLRAPADAWRLYEQACSHGLFAWPGMALTSADRSRFIDQAAALWSMHLEETAKGR